jgi:hypothetical protein
VTQPINFLTSMAIQLHSALPSWSGWTSVSPARDEGPEGDGTVGNVPTSIIPAMKGASARRSGALGTATASAPRLTCAGTTAACSQAVLAGNPADAATIARAVPGDLGEGKTLAAGDILP